MVQSWPWGIQIAVKKILKNGQRHLGTVIDSKQFKREYIESVVNNWNDQLILICLSKIAEIRPQAAYAVFIMGFKSKFTYILWTILDNLKYFQPTEETIANKFIPAISGHYCQQCWT